MSQRNIHILPTLKMSRLYKRNDTQVLYIGDLGLCETHDTLRTNQYVYITNNDKFKINEWITDGIETIKATPKLVDGQGLVNRRNWRKIILTNDLDLIRQNVNSIDDNFLEWLIDNPTCEYVETYEFGFDDSIIKHPKKWYINIPKEEPKEENCCQDVSGFYLGTTCPKCHKPFRSVIQEPKQETLEEAFKRIRYELDYSEFDFASFRLGAKWQEQRMYSEEEVLEIIRQYALEEHLITSSKPDIWFTNFKKK